MASRDTFDIDIEMEDEDYLDVVLESELQGYLFGLELERVAMRKSMPVESRRMPVSCAVHSIGTQRPHRHTS